MSSFYEEVVMSKGFQHAIRFLQEAVNLDWLLVFMCVFICPLAPQNVADYVVGLEHEIDDNQANQPSSRATMARIQWASSRNLVTKQEQTNDTTWHPPPIRPDQPISPQHTKS